MASLPFPLFSEKREWVRPVPGHLRSFLEARNLTLKQRKNCLLEAGNAGIKQHTFDVENRCGSAL
jgi:hypothetical protein